MLAEVDAAELTEWMAFDRIDPFGAYRADARAGMLAAAVVNHSMSPPKRAATPLDFMPFVRAEQDKPRLLKDPRAHSKLLEKTLFGGNVVIFKQPRKRVS